MFRFGVCFVALASVFCINEEARVGELLARLDAAEGLLHGYEKRLAAQAFQVDIQQTTINTLNQTSQEITQAAIPVGFTAFATEQREYQEGDTILFDTIRYNVGDDYFKDSSHFVCPYTGLYFFSATLFTELDNHMSADIVIDGFPIVQVWAADTLQSDQATNMVFVECLIGQHVWVQCVVPGILEGFPHPIAVTTFSGAIIEML